MRTFCSLPVPRSLALTLRMPLWSMSNVTSICGAPRGAGGMPSRLNWASSRFDGLVGDRAFPLEDAHRHGRLVVLRRGEDLLLRRRDGGVARDQLGHHAAHASRCPATAASRPAAARPPCCPAGAAPLDGGADGHHLVGVDALVALLAEDLLDHLLHARHARHAADQHDLVDVAGLVARRPEGPSAPGRGSARPGAPSAARTSPASATSAGASGPMRRP